MATLTTPEEIHVGDIGAVFLITIKDSQTNTSIDVSGATTKQIIFQKPDGTLLTKDAEFTDNGSDGQIQYQTVSGDLDVKGDWKIQAYIVIPSGSWRTNINNFRVYENI